MVRGVVNEVIQGYSLGIGASQLSTSAIGVSSFLFVSPSAAVCFVTIFLFSVEFWDIPLDFVEGFESRELFAVD